MGTTTGTGIRMAMGIIITIIEEDGGDLGDGGDKIGQPLSTSP